MISSTEIDKVVEKTKGKARIRGRGTLADISNMPRGVAASNQYYKSGPSLDALIKHIELLQKEKAAFVKRLAEKNKVIELVGTEMQKLRATLEKVKQQNLQLAQSNSQMLEELRLAKEKQKTLNHELGCKNGLLIAKNLELEGKDKTRMCQADDSDHNKVTEVTEPEETEVCTVAEGEDDKHNTNNRRPISKSLVHSNKKVQDTDEGKSKRLQRRRQSAKSILHDATPTQDSLNINNVDDVQPCSLLDNDGHDHDDDDKIEMSVTDAGTSSSSKMEDNESDSFEGYNKTQEHRKSSLSRPVREAAKKVQSYKELNLNVKMRRN